VQAAGHAGGEPRYRLLDTIREFGLEQLGASGEAEETRRAAAVYGLALAERSVPHLAGSEQRAWLDRLEAEHDNLRAALAWSDEAGEVEIGLPLAIALARFWYIRGHVREGRQWLEGMAERGRGLPQLAGPRARALSGAAVLAAHQGDFERAAVLGEEALALVRDPGSQEDLAHVLGRLAAVAGQRGDYGRCAELNEESRAVHRALGNHHGVAAAQADIGQSVLMLGELDRAEEILGDAVARLRELGDERGASITLGNLGRAAVARGDPGRAAAYYEEAIALDRRLGYKRGLAIKLDLLADTARLRGKLDQARALQLESLGLWRELADPIDVAGCLEGFASLAAASGGVDAAARLLGAAAALRDKVGFHKPGRPMSGDSELDATRAAVAEALGESGFATAQDAGRALSLDAVFALAKSVGAGQAASASREGRPFGLTLREQEVLALVAGGQSDREIADALFISHATARQHVANILGKLGVNSRTAAAGIAFREELAELPREPEALPGG
jgi:DNA-binding CsgD family transcriptional regulator